MFCLFSDCFYYRSRNNAFTSFIVMNLDEMDGVQPVDSLFHSGPNIHFICFVFLDAIADIYLLSW